MSYVRRRVAAIIVAIITLIGAGLVWPSSAQAWGSVSACDNPRVKVFTHTNRWKPFIGHHLDAHMKVCIKYPIRSGVPDKILKYVKLPIVTFPGIFPTGATESISVTKQPFLYKVAYYTYLGRTYVGWVTFKMSVRQCVVGSPFCNDFDFKITADVANSQICFVGGACDDPKHW